jgi:hypothetical protein
MQQYFPAGTLDGYAKYLVALQEASLWELSRKVKHAHFWDAPTLDSPAGKSDGADPAHALGIALVINLARFRLLYQEVY